MSPDQQKTKTESLRALHHNHTLILPNAWDVASARIIQQAGFSAVATTSAGIAFTLGYPDGQRISREEMLAAVARIAKAVKLPVTADVEAGYGNRPEDAARTARDVLAAGAVGMNLEDATGDPQHPLLELALQVERVKAVRELPIVLNARTDVYLLEVGPPEKRYDEALRRLAAFRDAGADCVFVPGLRDAADNRAFRERLAVSGKYPGRPRIPVDTGTAETGRSPSQRRIGRYARNAWPPATNRGRAQGRWNLHDPRRRNPFRRRKPHDGVTSQAENQAFCRLLV